MQADIRIIAATNQDLTRLIAEGRFREDLFYRINVIPISLPPLRERREDISLIAEHFLHKYNEQMGKDIAGISHQAMDLLQLHDWPGNIRELENVMERAVALEPTPSILPDSLPPSIRGDVPRVPVTNVDGLPESGFDLEAHVKEIERGYIAEALEESGWRAGQGRRTAGHELPVVPLLRQEIQPALTLFRRQATDILCQPAIYVSCFGSAKFVKYNECKCLHDNCMGWHRRCSSGRITHRWTWNSSSRETILFQKDRK